MSDRQGPIDCYKSARILGLNLVEALTHTLKLRFLYVTDSTLNPMVGMVVTTSPIYYGISM